MRLIDDDAVKEIIKSGVSTDTYDDIEYVCGLIDELPTIDIVPKRGEWTPCSERLPSEDEQDPELGVIVTLGNGYHGLQYDCYHNGYWYDWDGFVVAWMPLPKPWKGAEADRKE